MKKMFFIPLFFILYSLFFSTALAQEDATSSVRDLVREKVKEQIDVLLKKPRAAVGKLDEVTDSTLRILTQNGEVLLASTNKNTTYARVVASKTTEIKFTDLVLGDFVVAMGYKNETGVLSVERIVSYEESPIENKESIFGTVTQVTKTVLTIQTAKEQTVWAVKIDKSTKLTKKSDNQVKDIKLSDIKVGDRVIAAGTINDKTQNTLDAGRIHILQ